MNVGSLKRALSQVLDENDCPTGEWALNVIVPDLTGLTVGEDTGTPLVPLYDADGCVVGWVVKVVTLTEAA